MSMRFGFLAQPVGPGQRNAVRMAALATAMLRERTADPEEYGPGAGDLPGRLRVPVLREVVSAAGARCTGDVRYLPYTAEDMLRYSSAALDVVTAEARALAADGAAIIGLGGASSIIGDRGLKVAAAVPAAVTSGNSLTAHAAWQTALTMADLLGIAPDGEPIAVVGYPGSIGLVLARLLLGGGYRLVLVHRPGARTPATLLRDLDPADHPRVRLCDDPAEAFGLCRLILAASSTGGVIDPAALRGGSVVVDVALPRDLPESAAARDDVLVLDGGLVSADHPGFRVNGAPMAPTRQLNGCLAETMVLALEGLAESWSLGRELDPDRVLRIGAMAERHGVVTAPPASFGRPLREAELDRFARRPARRPAAAGVAGSGDSGAASAAEPHGGHAGHVGVSAGHAVGHSAGHHLDHPDQADRVEESGDPRLRSDQTGTGTGTGPARDLLPPRDAREARDLARGTAERFRRHVNPPMAGLLESLGIDHVFTSATGSTLTTADGTDFLDFVAGYGCLNLGHNPPAVVSRLHEFLDSGAPTFVQYVSMPWHTSVLAERLCEVAPPGLERVFFSNSGTEAIEAALKTARAATGRSRLVHVEGSYHGKTLGALSVTGRSSHRETFGPLVGDCVGVPFGDEAALAAAIDGAAAFIVEPVLGEGGVVLPPEGYLAAAQRLCRAAGAVFILDEVQTGLGRTGALFAAEHWDLRPDILCVAKSLSGGLVPIGATLSTAEVWDAAFGSTSRAARHSSTFGGGNLAAAAGLATLDAVAALDLPARAGKLGQVLREALAEACRPYSFVKQVRGIGMMNAIEFDPGLDGAFAAMAEDAMTRLPGDLSELSGLLDDDSRRALRAAGSALETTFGDLFCLRFVRTMAREHRVLTFVTANHNRVLRIQPPLVLTEAEADRFVAAVAATAAAAAPFADLAARS